MRHDISKEYSKCGFSSIFLCDREESKQLYS